MPKPSLLDEKLDQLYAADPADFVALRKQLQAELRAAANKPEAALLGRARRPSTSMWAVNQMVRRRPELVNALLERSDELRIAQTQTHGDRDSLRAAIRAHRTALDDATVAAVGVLGSRANDAFREEIVSLLRAASSQPDIGRELRVGRLVRSDDTTPGFPDLGGSPSEPPESRRRPDREATKERSGVPPAQEHEAVKEEAARAAENAARLELDRALQDEATADAAAAAARQRVEELVEQLSSARRELREAQARARKARAESARFAKLVQRVLREAR